MTRAFEVRREIRPTRLDQPCKCILATHPEFEGHLEREHAEEPCSGSWGWNPPCGGCINCIAAQAYYYQHLAEVDPDAV
jgi:hypothetical protein